MATVRDLNPLLEVEKRGSNPNQLFKAWIHFSYRILSFVKLVQASGHKLMASFILTVLLESDK
jgi:hypothetical protein